MDGRIIFRIVDKFGGEYMGCKECKINEAAQNQISAMDDIKIVDDIEIVEDNEIEDTEGKYNF